jgi:carbamoyltransferase
LLFRQDGRYTHYENFAELAEVTAQQLTEGKVVGWFQGRMEFGPRALGNRSILADARSSEMQQRLNQKIKFRESFRPFAPTVLKEDAPDYFDLDTVSPYMLLVRPVAALRRTQTIAKSAGEWREQLAQARSDIPAVTHVDFSARIQTVDDQTNPRFAQLLRAFKQLTGHGLVVNTSFNVRDEPIVCSPQDALRCFYQTEMDILIMENFLIVK